jgi:steroid delta-isomerase-like uncharacterized protein
MAEQDNIQIVNRALAAINAHDLDSYLKLVDDSCVGESEAAGTYQGVDGTRRVFTTMLQAFPDLHYEIEQIIASEDQVVIRSVLTGTHRGTFAGTAPTSKAVRWRSCSVVQIRNGRLVRIGTYSDNMSLLRQIGVLPMPATAKAG